ncbi:MAG: DeoR/GlpR family DNA-binding transcription regulator, partial [Actinomycetota bacterium]|nr:DeoR/GlpR family DNA-binding transcription regulator [Actinomycetota bacterium]
MTTRERRTEIQALVAQRGKVRISELAEHFEVSEMTIRRDLETLESAGLTRRVIGGAISTVSRSYEPPFASRVVEAQEAKRAIAEAASAYVEFGETAILDVGSTALELARVLRNRAGLTVITANVRAAVELSSEPSMRVILCGGEVRPGELSLIGAGPERTFAELNCDVLFL